jgi:hypothetical protein
VHVEGKHWLDTDYSRAEYLKGKVKYNLEQLTKAQRVLDVKLYSFFNLGTRWGGWLTPRPGRFTPREDPVPTV